MVIMYIIYTQTTFLRKFRQILQMTLGTTKKVGIPAKARRFPSLTNNMLSDCNIEAIQIKQKLIYKIFYTNQPHGDPRNSSIPIYCCRQDHVTLQNELQCICTSCDMKHLKAITLHCPQNILN